MTTVKEDIPDEFNILRKVVSSKITSTLSVKLLLTLPLLFSLYLLRDETSTEGNEHARLSLFTALASHPPSNRVFRGMSEIILLLYCAAFSLKFWEGNLGPNVIGNLLFQPDEVEEDVPVTEVHGNGADYDYVGHDDESEESEKEEEGDEETDEHLPIEISHKDDFVPLPPSASSVASAATDLLLFYLICLLLFTYCHTTNTRTSTSHLVINLSGIAAPIFPLLLFFFAATAIIFPWSKRAFFFRILRRTVEAPFYDVTFRDGFVGDILTSTVRPLQDLTFTLFYLFSGLQGWWSSQYNLDQAAAPVEHSWLVYTVLLPACVVSPLWWRFLQNLRQSHDSKQRWPYLGNALKYFLAAQVALFGVFTPSNKKSLIWIGSFVTATLYQIWWDTFMDWQLFVRVPNYTQHQPSWKTSYMLRPNRLYPNKSLYYIIFFINLLLRFCWTLSFLPPQTLSKAGLIMDAFGSDFETFISPVLATAEIIRRTLWGFLRVEWEAIKNMEADEATRITTTEYMEDGIEMSGIYLDNEDDLKKMGVESSHGDSMNLDIISTTKIPSFFSMIQSDMSHSSEIQIMGELCLWATVFTSVGILAAAHRG